MNRQSTYLSLTLVISVVVGIILPLTLGIKDPTYIAISFGLVWAIYSMIFLGYVFLVEGRHGRNKSERRNEEDPSFLHSIQEWEVLWEITIKRHKDNRGMGNPDWN